MKRFAAFILLLTSCIASYAATGSRSGDEIVLFGPLAILAVIGLGYIIKEKVKAIRQNRLKEVQHPGLDN